MSAKPAFNGVHEQLGANLRSDFGVAFLNVCIPIRRHLILPPLAILEDISSARQNLAHPVGTPATH